MTHPCNLHVLCRDRRWCLQSKKSTSVLPNLDPPTVNSTVCSIPIVFPQRICWLPTSDTSLSAPFTILSVLSCRHQRAQKLILQSTEIPAIPCVERCLSGGSDFSLFWPFFDLVFLLDRQGVKKGMACFKWERPYCKSRDLSLLKCSQQLTPDSWLLNGRLSLQKQNVPCEIIHMCMCVHGYTGVGYL